MAKIVVPAAQDPEVLGLIAATVADRLNMIKLKLMAAFAFAAI